MVKQTMIHLTVAAACGLLAGQAFAGTAAGSAHFVNLDVVGADGTAWTLNLGNLVSFDSATGALSLDTSSLKAAPVADAQGEWSLITKGSTDLDGSIASSDRIKWHSWMRADGSGQTSTSGSPWASVISFTAAGNVDPFMSYGFSARNNAGITQTYTFTMGEAIVPTITGAYDLHAEVSGSLVNPAGTGTLVINPALADGDGDGIAELQALRLSNDGGSTYVNGGVDVGQKITVASGTASQGYGIYNADTSGAGSFNYWAIETKFTLTPNKDVAVIAGYVEITPVPEPVSSAMLLAGLGLIGCIARRRL